MIDKVLVIQVFFIYDFMDVKDKFPVNDFLQTLAFASFLYRKNLKFYTDIHVSVLAKLLIETFWGASIKDVRF